MSTMLRWSPEELARYQARTRPPQVQPTPDPTGARSKYGAKTVEADGRVFDSRAEYRRWCDLVAMQRAGHIRELRCQVRYELLPSQRKPSGGTERGVAYVADFVYLDADGRQVVEDVKGVRTPEFILKRKLMLHIHGIEIQEVSR